MNQLISFLIICSFLCVTVSPVWCQAPGDVSAASKPVNYQASVRESLDKLVAAYEAKNSRDFLALVSESYVGDKDGLSNVIRRQFSQFANMSIRYTFNNVTYDGNGKISAAVTISKDYTDVKTGKQVTWQGQTSMIFILNQNTCLLYTMNPPAFFGLK